MLKIKVKKLSTGQWCWVMAKGKCHGHIAQSYFGYKDAIDANASADRMVIYLLKLGIDADKIKIEYGQYDLPATPVLSSNRILPKPCLQVNLVGRKDCSFEIV